MVAFSILLKAATGCGASVLRHGAGGTGSRRDHPPLRIPPVREGFHGFHGPQALGAVNHLESTKPAAIPAVL